MNNLIQTVWLLAWPILIFIIYKILMWILKNYEDKLENEE